MMADKLSGRLPVIHIGMPKTATKTLQWRLFAGHSEIYYMGRFDGPFFQGRYRRFAACRDATVFNLMQQIAYGEVYDPDFAACRELFTRISTTAARENLLPVWSWESYSTDILAKRRVRARNLKRVFGAARIIMTLRNPVGLLESAYFQQLKRDNVSLSARLGDAPFYYSIEEWLERFMNTEIMPHLQYAETIQAYVEQFGPENVSLFLFEELLEDRPLFFTRICNSMGIDPEEGVRLTAESTDNERWTTAQIEALQKIKGSQVQSLRFRFAPRRRRKELLGLNRRREPVVKGAKARAPIPPAWREKIFALTLEGNHWLAETFALPLAHYGYFG